MDPQGQAAAPACRRHTDALIPAVSPDAVPAVGRTRLCFPGLSAQSSLGRLLAAALAGEADAVFPGSPAPAASRWSRAVAGTTLQWWSNGDTEPHAGHQAADVNVDLHGDLPGDLPSSADAGQGRRWRLVDGSGVALLAAFHALQACHRVPFTASLYLIEAEADSNGRWRVLAEAHVASSVRYAKLLDTLGRATSHLLRTGLRADDGPAICWHRTSPAPAPAMPLVRSRVAGAAAWLRARASGDLYGIALLQATTASLLHDGVLTPPEWREVPAGQGFIADPFFWPGRPGVALCEHYSHRSGNGHLASIAIGPAAADPGPATPALTAGHHLSYPFTFTDGERTVCVPEMMAARRQLLYEVKEDRAMSPICAIAEDVAFADPTLTRHDGLYWLSYTDADIGASDNLCLMFAERLEGPWRRHPGNPVKFDVRSSRPGGTPFWVEGQLYRPAQDCSQTYGGALVINAVRTCTPSRYHEQAIATLRPDAGGRFPDGLHTLAIDGERIVIDGKRISYHPAILWNKIRRRLPGAHWPQRHSNVPVVVVTTSRGIAGSSFL